MKKDGNAHDKSQKRKAAELIYEGLAETKEEYKLEATSLHDTLKNSSRTKHRWTWARIAVAAATVSSRVPGETKEKRTPLHIMIPWLLKMELKRHI